MPGKSQELHERWEREIGRGRANTNSSGMAAKPRDRAEQERLVQERLHELAQEEYKRYQHPRVAPLTDVQKDIITQQINLANSFDPYENRLNTSIERMMDPNLRAAMEPYLTAFNKPQEEAFSNLLGHHHQYITEPIFNRATRMLNEALPGVDTRFALQGNFYGGQRRAAQRELMRKFTENAHNEALHAMGQAMPSYLQHLHGTRGQELGAAQLAGETSGKQAGENRAVLNALNATRMADFQHQIEKLGLGEKAAHREQEQFQREKNADIEEFERQTAHPWNQIIRESNVLNNIPTPIQTFNAVHQPAPPPPNTPAMMSNVVQQLSPLFMGKKEGGEIRHFDGGGSTGLPPMMDKYLPAMHNAEVMQMQQNAQQLQNTHPNRDAQRMALAGARTGQYFGGPWGAFSAGNEASILNEQAIDEARYGHMSKASDIWDKIQSSRIDQQKMVMEHQKNLRHEAENKRLHDSQISLNKAHEGYYNQQHKIPNIVEGHHITIDPKTGRVQAEAIEGFTSAKNRKDPIIIGDREIHPTSKVGMTPQDQIQLKEIGDEITLLQSKLEPYTALGTFIGGNTPSTGIVPYFTPRPLQSDKNREYGRILNDAVATKIPAGRPTDAGRQFARESKPTELDSPESVKQFATKGSAAIKEQLEPMLFARSYAAYGIPPRITLGAYESWAAEGKPGEFTDYLGDVMEGKIAPKLPSKVDKTPSSLGGLTPELEARRQELEAKRKS